MSGGGGLDHYACYRSMREQRIVMAFLGSLSQEVLVGFAEGLRELLELRKVGTRVTKRVFAILVELAQNMAAYSTERDALAGSGSTVGVGLLVVTEDEASYSVASGNLTPPETARAIASRCELINAMSLDELKGAYRARLRRPREEGQQTGGVGLMQVALNARPPLECRVEHHDPGHVFLVISATVPKEKTNG